VVLVGVIASQDHDGPTPILDASSAHTIGYAPSASLFFVS
jgi:hypothetical protein